MYVLHRRDDKVLRRYEQGTRNRRAGIEPHDVCSAFIFRHCLFGKGIDV